MEMGLPEKIETNLELAFHALRTFRVKETVNESSTIKPFNAELVLVS